MRFNVTVEAITFDALVEHGKRSGAPLNNGMPWSFEYQGFHVTHENDDCYLVAVSGGTERMNRGDVLITGLDGELFVMPATKFIAIANTSASPQATEVTFNFEE